MKRFGLLILIYIAFLDQSTGQYLLNPSMEGTILMIGPPPYWDICIDGSTPNVQPGKYAVYLPPSDGITYVGLLTRPDFTWEDMHSILATPLSKDSCYILKIDLAFWEFLSFTTVDPVVLKVYGSNNVCQKNNLLWQSPPISNEEWLTFEFMIHNDNYDITDLIFEAYYVSSFPYYGYILMDNIRIEQTPQFELGNDTTLAVCENDPLILDPGSGFVAYLWQDGSTQQTYAVSTTGLYWVQAFNAQGCSWTDSVYVTVEEYVEMDPEMFDLMSACEGQEVTFGVTVQYGVGPYSYSWTGLPDTTSSITVVADSTRYYIVTITDHCGFTVSDSLKLQVQPLPEINLGNDTLICIDGEYTLHAGSGYSQYLWQDGSTDSLLTISQPGTYWVMVTSVFGCTSVDSININVYPALPLNLGNDTTACEGTSLVLDAGIGYVTYLWQDYSTLQQFVVTVPGIYWVTVTDDKGCTATDSIQVMFVSQPVIDLGEDLAFCQGETQNITPGPGYLSYLWQDGSTGEFYNVTQTGYYWVTVDNGCGVDTDSVYAVVYPLPDPDLGPDTTICWGEVITLYPGGGFVSYKWQDNSIFPTYEASVTGLYSVEVENNYGCKALDEIYLLVSHPQVFLGEDTFVCEGDILILDAGDGFEQYQWQDNSDQQTLAVTTGGIYGVVVTDESGCSATDDILVEQFPYPVASLGDDTDICSGESLVLQAPAGEYDYFWNGLPGGQTYLVNATGLYSLKVVNLCGEATDEIMVTVIPVPIVDLGPDNVLFPGQTLELDAGDGHDSYLWQDGSGSRYFVVTENNADPNNPYYYVEVVEGICKSSDTILVELFQVWVPKVITPNDDGLNDLFEPDPVRWQGITRHHMAVYNRWGEMVWESEDFPAGWDGKRNGKPVSEGTYYWILDVFAGPENIKKTLKGSLTVIGTGELR